MFSSPPVIAFYKLSFLALLVFWCTTATAQTRSKFQRFFAGRPISIILQDKTQDKDGTDEAQDLRRIEELVNKSEYEAAILLAEQVLSSYEKKHGPDHQSTIKVRHRLALLYGTKWDFASAKRLLLKTLAVTEKLRGAEHLTVSDVLTDLSDIYRQESGDDKAEDLLERALRIRERELGLEHKKVAAVLVRRASIYHDKYQKEKAEPLYNRALAIYEKALGPEHLEVASVLLQLSGLLTSDAARSDELFDRALEIFDKAAEARNPDAAHYIHSLAEAAEEEKVFDLARAMYLRAISLCQQLPDSERMLALVLNNLAELYRKNGRYDEAEPLYLRAISLDEKLYGADHPITAITVNNLALLYKLKKEYNLAEPLYLRAIASYSGTAQLNRVGLVQTHYNLAKLYVEKGDYQKAISTYQRLMSMTKEQPRSEPSIRSSSLVQPQDETFIRLSSLVHLAALYETLGAGRKAASIFRMVQAEAKKGSANEWDIGTELFDVALLFLQHGRPEKAEQVLARALAVSSNVGPPHHVITTLHFFGTVYRMKGNYRKAESFYQRALKQTGEDEFWDPDVGIIQNELAIFHQARGHTAQAIQALAEGSQISQHNLWQSLVLNEPTDAHNPYSMVGLGHETSAILSLQALHAPRNVKATRLALVTLLARKGRMLDVLTSRLREFESSSTPQAGKVLKQRRLLHARLGAEVLNGIVNTDPFLHQARVAELEWRLQKLESRDMPSSMVGVSNDLDDRSLLEGVQKNVPADGALVEIALYERLNFKHSSIESKWGEKRYVAYVLHATGQPQGIDLGDSDQIDPAVASFREALRDPQRTDVKTLARELDEKVMRPIRTLLKGKQVVLISPDGALNLIPFAALVDERGKFLVERYSFTYLSSGRDLLRLQQHSQSRQGPVIIADPDFGERTLSQPDGRTNLRGPDLTQAYFKPLPGTSDEARALKELLPEAVVLVKRDATETAVKAVDGPRILHIATHGFFLENTPDGASDRPDPNSTIGPARDLTHQSPNHSTMRIENLLLKSGLGLVGANLRRNREDDGLLTALEVSGLNLTGTKLVILSACDTGVGEVLSGDGVYGLRRALLLAGAESQIISLWPVSDRNTKDLMIDYYKALLSGEGRGAALRQVQLRLLSSPPPQSHPFYWASFIQSGKWANMNDEK